MQACVRACGGAWLLRNAFSFIRYSYISCSVSILCDGCISPIPMLRDVVCGPCCQMYIVKLVSMAYTSSLLRCTGLYCVALTKRKPSIWGQKSTFQYELSSENISLAKNVCVCVVVHVFWHEIDRFLQNFTWIFVNNQIKRLLILVEIGLNVKLLF